MNAGRCKHCGVGLMQLKAAHLSVQETPANTYPEARRVVMYECDVCNIRTRNEYPITYEFMIAEIETMMSKRGK